MEPILIASLPESGSTLPADLLDGLLDIVSLPDEPPVFRLTGSPEITEAAEKYLLLSGANERLASAAKAQINSGT
jgi:hypothetical protein